VYAGWVLYCVLAVGTIMPWAGHQQTIFVFAGLLVVFSGLVLFKGYYEPSFHEVRFPRFRKGTLENLAVENAKEAKRATVALLERVTEFVSVLLEMSTLHSFITWSQTEEARRQGRSTEPLKAEDDGFSVFVFHVPDEDCFVYTFAFVVLLMVIWFALCGYVASCIHTLHSKAWHAWFPFVRADFADKIPAMIHIVKLFASSLYAAIILKLFSMLSCTHNAEGQLVVAQMHTLKCWEGMHSHMATVAMLLIVYYSISSTSIAFYFMESSSTGAQARFVPFFILFERSATLAIAILKTLIVDKPYGPWVVLISAMSVFALLWVYVVLYAPCHHLRIFNVARATVYGLLLWSSLMATIDMGWDGVEFCLYLRYAGWLIGLVGVVYWYWHTPGEWNPQGMVRDPAEDDSVLPVDLSALQNFDEATNTKQNEMHQKIWYRVETNGNRIGWNITDVDATMAAHRACMGGVHA